MKDTILYDKLEISPTISDEDLKKEGRKLLLKWHPDKNENKEESAKRFIEIKEILDILTDTEQREKYHQVGVDILQSGNNNFSNNVSNNNTQNMNIFNGFNDFFGKFTKMVNNMNENSSNVNTISSSYDRDITYYVNINVYKITDINTFNITYKRHKYEICDICQGKGFVQQDINIGNINSVIYNTCKSENYKEEEKKIIITITIEKLLDIIEKNQTIILKDHGNILKDKSTDLIIIFNE
jgi:DnaJ-class molecular chaperone